MKITLMFLLQTLQNQAKVKSLKVSLVGAILTTIGATALIVYIPWAMASKRNVNAMVAQVNQEIAGATNQEVERLFRNAQSAQQLIQSSFAQGIIDLTDRSQQKAFFLNTLAAHPDFTWVQLGYANGDFVGAQRTPEGLLRIHVRDWNTETRTTQSQVTSYQQSGTELKQIDQQTIDMQPAFYAPQRPWYQNAIKKLGQPAWTVYVYRSTNAPGMDTTITLKQNQKTMGVVGVGIELTQLSRYLQQLKQDRPGEVFIINAKTELIASTDLKQVMPSQAQDPNQLQLRQFSETQNRLLQIASETIQSHQTGLATLKSSQRYVYTDPHTRDNYLISLTPVGHLDWTVGTIIPEANYLVEINRNRQILLVVISLFVVTTAGLSVLIIERLIAHPILQIAHAAVELEAETFEVVSLTPVARRTDELGQLARVFQKMAEQIKLREQRLKRQVQELKIEIDEAKLKKQVNDIVETDFFRDLTSNAQALRQRHQKRSAGD
jgi:HAMP domain